MIEAYKDKRGYYYLVCPPDVEGMQSRWIINLNLGRVSRFSVANTKLFLKNMKEVSLDITEHNYVSDKQGAPNDFS